MKHRSIAIALLLLLTVVAMPHPVQAGPYDQILCPMIAGKFVMHAGQLCKRPYFASTSRIDAMLGEKK